MNVLLMMFLLLISGCTPSEPIKTGKQVMGPGGYYKMCVREPENFLCKQSLTK
jgi:predicted transglutaminase-like cysteine proteinase